MDISYLPSYTTTETTNTTSALSHEFSTSDNPQPNEQDQSEYTEEYWLQRLRQIGIKRIRATVGVQTSSDDAGVEGIQYEDQEDTIHSEAIPAQNRPPKKKKSSLKKSKKKVIEPIETPEEIAEDALAKNVRISQYELDSLLALNSSLSVLTQSVQMEYPGVAIESISRIFSDILEEVVTELIQLSHHDIASGSYDHLPLANLQPSGVSAGSQIDIFGNDVSSYKLDTFYCDECERSVTANRFAPHLEKCTGLINKLNKHSHL